MISSSDIRDAMRDQDVFGNHNEHGLDADGWMLCSGTVEVAGIEYLVTFTALPDWSDWDLTEFKAIGMPAITAARRALANCYGDRFEALTEAQRVALIADVREMVDVEEMGPDYAVAELDVRIGNMLERYAATLVAGSTRRK